jgi:hypothetical protein
VKPLIVAVTAAVPILFLIADALDFAGGWAGHDIDAPFYIFPASGVVFLLGLFLFCTVAVITIVLAFRRQFRRAALLIAVLISSLTFLPLFWPQSPFLLGFLKRLQQNSSVAEIESLSQRCLALRSEGGAIYDAEETLGREAILDGIRVVDVNPPDVVFTWGGPLSGHWGIYVLGSPTSVFPAHSGRTLRFSDRILLFRGH